MEETITYVGLAVHKRGISVAVAEGGRRGVRWSPIVGQVGGVY